jgi:hypothetical protein
VRFAGIGGARRRAVEPARAAAVERGGGIMAVVFVSITPLGTAMLGVSRYGS